MVWRVDIDNGQTIIILEDGNYEVRDDVENHFEEAGMKGLEKHTAKEQGLVLLLCFVLFN